MAGRKQRKIEIKNLDDKALAALHKKLERVTQIKGNACEDFFSRVNDELTFRLGELFFKDIKSIPRGVEGTSAK